MARSRCHDDHGGSACEAVGIPFDVDVADSRVANSLASFHAVPDIVASPESAELSAANGQCPDDGDGAGMLGVSNDGGLEHPDVFDRHGAAVGEAQLSLVLKDGEQHVSFRGRQFFGVAKEFGGKRVPGSVASRSARAFRGTLAGRRRGVAGGFRAAWARRIRWERSTSSRSKASAIESSIASDGWAFRPCSKRW